MKTKEFHFIAGLIPCDGPCAAGGMQRSAPTTPTSLTSLTSATGAITRRPRSQHGEHGDPSGRGGRQGIHRRLVQRLRTCSCITRKPSSARSRRTAVRTRIVKWVRPAEEAPRPGRDPDDLRYRSRRRNPARPVDGGLSCRHPLPGSSDR